MKRYILYILFPITVYSQKKTDNVQAVYDSLEKVYYYNSIEVEEKNKFNFKKGEIPNYEPAIYQERINKLASRSPFNYRYNKIVQNYITMYSKRNKSTGTLLALADLYFPLYEKYLNQYGLPLELKYLSIVESALNPTAVSPCGASGLWQFMYGTGKGYKLEINSYVDERFDPEKETIAACNYLKDLFKIYGQWDLAIAAYNCGPGNVNKGIRKAGGNKDFWAIYDYLPKETQGYVPAFIAASYICEFHEEHNIQKAKANFLYNELDVIELNFKTNIKQLSQLLNMDYKELKYLNPKYITGVIPGSQDIVNVPKQKALDWIDIEMYLSKGKVPPKIIQNQKPIAKDKVIVATSNVKLEPIKTQPTKKQISPFGTYYSNTNNNQPLESAVINEQKNVNDFETKMNASKSYLCSANGDQTIVNGSMLTLRLQDDIYYKDVLIPKNSILIARANIKKESIVISISSAKIPSGEIPFFLTTEIFEKTSGKYLLEDGYSIMIRI